jgi:hypothetical protein
VRVAWAQNIGETDEAFEEFLYSIGTNSAENITRYINYRNRVEL